MPKSNIIGALEELDKKDIYSLILFVLYRLKKYPEYSTLSELVYVLDNESFINFLNYFGGSTITIPKVDDMRKILDSILFYERSINTDLTEDEIFEQLHISVADKKNIIETIKLIKDLVDEYEFKRSETLQ